MLVDHVAVMVAGAKDMAGPENRMPLAELAPEIGPPVTQDVNHMMRFRETYKHDDVQTNADVAES